MNELKPTALFRLHQELVAKMTGFAGYAMPLQYTGIIREHLHCRSQAGLFDISHMGQCRISGAAAGQALDGLTPGGITQLAVGRQKYTVLTNSEGGVIDDIIVSRLDDGYALIVNAACKEKDFQHLRQHLPADCLLEVDEAAALLALQGPAAVQVLQRFAPQTAVLGFMHTGCFDIGGVICQISRSGYTGEDGFEISLPEAEAEKLARLLLAEPEVAPIGLGARDTLRLEAGLCLYGHELNDKISPIEAGLRWICKKHHAGFPGAEAIRRQISQGPARIRVGLLVLGKIPVREGAVISDGQGREIGYVTSGAYAPSLQRPVAMALLENQCAAIGSELFANVRGQQLAVQVTSLPFVPHRYHR